MNDKHYTLEEISKTIKTPIPYLRRMIKEHKLVGSKMGRTFKCTEKDIQKYIDSCKVKYDR